MNLKPFVACCVVSAVWTLSAATVSTGVTQDWQTVVLENGRIRVTMLPDAVGKVWRAVDVATGDAFVDRGPLPKTAASADWTVRTNANDSVSAFASATEYVNGTTWQVEVLLRDGEDFFTTRTTWFNGANVEGPGCQNPPVTPFMPGSTDCFEERFGVSRGEGASAEPAAGASTATRPPDASTNVCWTSAYGHWLRGVRHLAARRDAEGEAELKAALSVEPVYPPAFDALASLACRRGRWREARDWAARALAVDAYDAAANYADGLASFRLGEHARAEERLELAAYRTDYRSAAYALMAKCAFRRGETRTALERALRSWQANSHNPESFFLRVAAHRKLNEPDRALKLSVMALHLFPLDHALRHERLELGAITEDEFRSLVRGESPEETVLGLADRYAEIGFEAEARKLWTSVADRSMLARIQLAKSFDDPEQLDDAAKLPLPEFGLHRACDAEAVAWAEERSNVWRWKYLRAVWCAATGLDAEARALLDGVDEADDPAFYLFRSKFKKGMARFGDLVKARKAGDSWRVGREMMALFVELGDWRSVVVIGEDYLKRFPGNGELEDLRNQARARLGKPSREK